MYKINELVTFWANLKPTEIAFADEVHEITFRELDILTRKIAFKLIERGLKRGEIAGIILPGHLAWLFSISLFRLGITTMTQNNLNNFSPELNPDWVLTLEPHPEKSPDRTVIINDQYLEIVNASKELEIFEGFSDPNEIATFYSTSGTNGEKKFQSLTASYMWTEALRLHASNGLAEDGVFILMAFGAPWTSLHVTTSLIMGKTYYNCMFTDERLLKFVSKYPIRTVMGSPTQISAFLDIQKQTSTKLPLLKNIIMGGSPPNEQLISRIKSQLDSRILNVYGSTEAGLVSVSKLGVDEPEGGWINVPIDLQIVDDNDNLLPAMSVGHIRYRRSDMTMSYYKNPTATAEYFKNGYFYPGDLGFIDEDGRLVLEGRSNDVINLGGVKVNPERIESIAHTEIGVRDCAAFARMSDSGVEQLCLALVVDQDFDQEKFEKAMAAKYSNPIRFYVKVPGIPRNENGKIQRNLLT